MRITCPTVCDTARVGSLLGKALLREAPVALLVSGAIGAGKTELARAVVRGACSDEELVVTSPTFVLMQSYDLPGGRHIHHLDLHRLQGVGDLQVLELDALWRRRDCFIFEWPELLRESNITWPRVDVSIELEASSDTRHFHFEAHNGGENILRALQ